MSTAPDLIPMQFDHRSGGVLSGYGMLMLLLLVTQAPSATAQTATAKVKLADEVAANRTGQTGIDQPGGPESVALNTDGAKSTQTGEDVFQAATAGKVRVKLIQQSEKGGYLLLQNTTTESLNVRFPDAFVGVNAVGNAQGTPLRGQGAAQSTGIAFSPGQGPQNGQSGVFSVPPGRTMRLNVTSVCLEYGRPEPNSNHRYVIMPVEKYSSNPVFHELLPLFARTRASQRVAQASAWHLANGLTWTELAGLTSVRGRAGVPLPIFSADDLRAARALVHTATLIAGRHRHSGPSTAPPKTTKSRRSAGDSN